MTIGKWNRVRKNGEMKEECRNRKAASAVRNSNIAGMAAELLSKRQRNIPTACVHNDVRMECTPVTPHVATSLPDATGGIKGVTHTFMHLYTILISVATAETN